MFASLFTDRRRIVIAAAIIIILIALGAAIAWQQYFRSPSDAPGTLPSPIVTAPPATPPPAPSGVEGPPATPAYTGAAVQTLNPNADILKQVPADTYEKSRNELAGLAVSLAANPRDADGWMRVAFIKRFYGDYAGTRDAYEYLNVIAGGDGLSFFTLAGLYGYYLKEPGKAIPKYEAALQRDPMNPAYYSGFADFYREVMKDLPAAERVLERGLAKAPADTDLMVSYAALSEMMGKTARAIEYYEKVLARSDLGAPRRAAIIADVSRLKAQNP